MALEERDAQNGDERIQQATNLPPPPLVPVGPPPHEEEDSEAADEQQDETFGDDPAD